MDVRIGIEGRGHSTMPGLRFDLDVLTTEPWHIVSVIRGTPTQFSSSWMSKPAPSSPSGHA